MPKGGRSVRRNLWVLILFLASLTSLASAQAEPVTWMVTEWGSVYRNLEKVADKKFEDPQHIAGNADHYWVNTRDGSVWKDGTRIVTGVHKDENVTDLDVQGDDYYLLTLQGRLYKNGQVLIPEGRMDRPKHLVLVGSDAWVMDEGGWLYRNGEKVGDRWYLGGYYPTHFATDGKTVWSSISGGTAEGYYIYKDRAKENEETWLVRDLSVVGGHLYVFSGKSIFRDGQRVARWEPEKAKTTSHVDNPIDFFFVHP